MSISTESATRLSIATECVAMMEDSEWNAFVVAETARRNYTAKPFEVNDRVRFVLSTRPKKLAHAPGTIIERKTYAGEWLYKVRMDNSLTTYVRVKRASLEAI